MHLFLIFYFLIYGGAQFYFLTKIHHAFPRLGLWIIVPSLFLLLMLAAPIVTILLDRSGSNIAVRIISLISFTWMAISLWAAALFAAGDLWNLVIRIAGKWSAAAGRLTLPPQPTLIVVAGLIAAACVWAVIEASSIRVREIPLTLSRLPAGSQPIRLVQISDVHLDLLVPGRAAKVARLAAAARPDILVSTGDLVDAPLDGLRAPADLLRDIPAPLGKFAVTGNHEYYAGIQNSIAFHEAAGFQLLRGESVLTGGRLRIAGVDDLTGRQFGERDAVSDNAALPPAAGREATVFLKHRPLPADPARFDLQLSGHVHDGQIFPFRFVVRLFFRQMSGLTDLGDSSRLYVSHGTGTWGPPMRLFAPPEITVFILSPPAEK